MSVYEIVVMVCVFGVRFCVFIEVVDVMDVNVMIFECFGVVGFWCGRD